MDDAVIDHHGVHYALVSFPIVPPDRRLTRGLDMNGERMEIEWMIDSRRVAGQFAHHSEKLPVSHWVTLSIAPCWPTASGSPNSSDRSRRQLGERREPVRSPRASHTVG